MRLLWLTLAFLMAVLNGGCRGFFHTTVIEQCDTGTTVTTDTGLTGTETGAVATTDTGTDETVVTGTGDTGLVDDTGSAATSTGDTGTSAASTGDTGAVATTGDTGAVCTPIAVIWYDGVDQDCDGEDECDSDSDGFDAVACGGGDCNDVDPNVYPGHVDPVNDCDVVACDADGDGFDAIACGGDDCNDDPATGGETYPGAAQNQYLNPASEFTDPLACMKDDDDDGYGDAYPWNLLPGVVPGTDCNDSPGCVVADCSILHPVRGDAMMGADVYYNAADPEANHFGGNDIPENCEPNRDEDGDGYCNALDEDGVDTDGDGLTDDEAYCFFDDLPGDCENTDPSISYDDDASVNPGVAEVAGDGIDNNCDGEIDENDVAVETGDTGLVDIDCPAGESRLSCTYVAPVGATNVVVSAERYNAAGTLIRGMSTLVDGADGFTVDSTVAGQVTFSDSTCIADTDQWYLSASFSGAGSYSCVGTANPSYTAYGTFTCQFDNDAAGISYVNNYETPLGFPSGYGPGCEVGVDH